MDTYEIELEPAEPDGFTAIVPAVPACSSSAVALTRSSSVLAPRLHSTLVGQAAIEMHDGSMSCFAALASVYVA